MRITDWFNDEYASAALERDAENAKGKVWRIYANAAFAEMARRNKGSIGGPRLRWRRSRQDDNLPRPYKPFWMALSGQELSDLLDALEEAKYEGKSPPTPPEP